METEETVHSDYEDSQDNKLAEDIAASRAAWCIPYSQDKKLAGETAANSPDEATLQTPKVAGEKATFGRFIFITFVCFAVAIFLGCKAYDVKNNYSYENQYVKGDAYNFIINAGYFAGYSVSCAISVLGGIVSWVTAGIINAINKSR